MVVFILSRLSSSFIVHLVLSHIFSPYTYHHIRLWFFTIFFFSIHISQLSLSLHSPLLTLYGIYTEMRYFRYHTSTLDTPAFVPTYVRCDMHGWSYYYYHTNQWYCINAIPAFEENLQEISYEEFLIETTCF